ncbi:hypothetical protein K0M31_001874 [Melipona bicolor]|uniref:Uncharacterized protein n=1 Tax=Melipona bicolor TaxID=60889 RepID=A0AA40GGN8_9HYME|nr:hypothetical protein K0M31_001874 [Melipona bicolor]
MRLAVVSEPYRVLDCSDWRSGEPGRHNQSNDQQPTHMIAEMRRGLRGGGLGWHGSSGNLRPT